MGLEFRAAQQSLSTRRIDHPHRAEEDSPEAQWLEDLWPQMAPALPSSGRELWRAILEGSGDAVYAKDSQGRYVLFNHAAERLLGKPQNQVLGRDDGSLFAPTEAQRMRQADREVIAAGKPVTYEETLTDAAGRVKTLLSTKGPLVDELGNVCGVFGIARDISELKRTQEELLRAREEQKLQVLDRTADLKATINHLQQEMEERRAAQDALKESEERYRRLFESAPVGIELSNYQGEILAANQRLCEMFGVTPAEARTTRAAAFLRHPSEHRRLLARVRKHGVVEDWEALFRRKDGSSLLGLARVQEITIGKEKILLSIIQDITRQREAERRIEGVAALLELFVTRSTRQKYLQAVVRLLADWCGCQCAGVRLLDAARRLPFVAKTGFSPAFVRHESGLQFGPRGGCACVRVLLGRPHPQDECCSTVAGSLYCNQAGQCAGQLAASPERTREVACVNAGHQSLAQVPIRYHGQLLGTLHLADHRPDRFPTPTITFLEAVAPLVGEAIHRFNMEEALLESEERFRSMFERHKATMLLVDPQTGALVDANPAAARFYGYSREKLCRMNISQLNMLPAEAVAAARTRAQRERRNVFVFPHRLANGEVRTVEVHSSPIAIKGRLILFSIIQDITERKRLQKLVLDVGEQERRRVGQDLHDSLGGRLTGAALMSKALARSLAERRRTEAPLAREIVDCINEAIGQTRLIARGLAPLELSVAGLGRGLEELAAETQKRTGVSCRFEGDTACRIQDAFLATHLYRIVQEAVHNAIRHGKSRHIVIRTSASMDQLRLEIRDDGRGFASGFERKGQGLRNMRYRADSIGAHLTINSVRGQGTAVICELPLRSIRGKKKTCRA